MGDSHKLFPSSGMTVCCRPLGAASTATGGVAPRDGRVPELAVVPPAPLVLTRLIPVLAAPVDELAGSGVAGRGSAFTPPGEPLCEATWVLPSTAPAFPGDSPPEFMTMTRTNTSRNKTPPPIPPQSRRLFPWRRASPPTAVGATPTGAGAFPPPGAATGRGLSADEGLEETGPAGDAAAGRPAPAAGETGRPAVVGRAPPVAAGEAPAGEPLPGGCGFAAGLPDSVGGAAAGLGEAG